MNTVLSVKNLTKNYDTFKLDNASFDIEKGEIAFCNKRKSTKQINRADVFRSAAGCVHY